MLPTGFLFYGGIALSICPFDLMCDQIMAIPQRWTAQDADMTKMRIEIGVQLTQQVVAVNRCGSVGITAACYGLLALPGPVLVCFTKSPSVTC